LTLGLFTFVVNALMLMLTSGIISGFHVQGFWSAIFGSLVISLVSWLLTSVVNDEGRIEVIVLRRRGKDRWE
jgi:putative membrane protein